MSIVCIPKIVAEKIKTALKGKDITLAKLFDIRLTEDRIKYLEKFVGENAKDINTLFEQKLILKNQYAGLKNFIDKITASGRYNEAKKVELAKALEDWKVKQQERIFNPKEGEIVLGSLIEKIVGSTVSEEQRTNIAKFSIAVNELKKGFDETTSKWNSEKQRIEYGASKVILENYISELKTGGLNLKGMLMERMEQFKETYKTNKSKAVADLLIDTLKTFSDNSISLAATLDNSFIGRQGLKTLMTHPTVWWQGAKNSFIDIAKTMGGQEMKDALMADIYSNPNYLNGTYEMAKILPRSEEQYPTSLPERIWGFGRLIKASQVAFEGSAIRMRTGLYDLVSGIAEKNGVDIAEKYQIQSMGKMINSLTARGQWGKTGEPTIVRLVMWAPKMLKANIDVLTAHTGQDLSGFARKQAAINLAKIVATSVGIMAIANAIKPGSAELDPRSSLFGKIKIGNTTFDYTGGAGSLIVLAARQLSGASKSTSTGLIRPFGTEYGQQTRFDTLIDFLTGKTTPPMGALISFLKGTTPIGQKTTLANTAGRIITPISLQNATQLKDDNSANAVLGVILDVLGINANTYIAGQTDWTQNTGAELQAFQKKVGDVKFKEANDLYNKNVSDWFNLVKVNPQFSTLSDEDKQKVITRKKGEIKDKIFRQYGFYYKSPTKKLPKF